MKLNKLITLVKNEFGFETDGEALNYLLKCFDELNYRDWRVEDLNLSIKQYLEVQKSLGVNLK
jgi:hypothetical protein